MAHSDWQPGPARPRLAPGAVDVWLLALDGPPPQIAPLSGAERERAARFLSRADGERWATARATLRALLAAYLDADPSALRFTEGPHGKPALAGAAGAPPLHFNLSHSADTALVAVACDREVGVDVELPRRAVDHVAIARRVLGEDQAARLERLDGEERERAFLRAWVRWEAALKCAGTGIGAAAAVPDGSQPWIRELEIGPHGAAALAVAGGPVAVRGWRWPAAAPSGRK